MTYDDILWKQIASDCLIITFVFCLSRILLHSWNNKLSRFQTVNRIHLFGQICCRWAPLINNYKYLTALHCWDPLWRNRQECKMERQLNIWLWMTKASVCTVVWAKRQRSDYTAIVRLHSNTVHYSNRELRYERGATFTWSFIFHKVKLYVVQPLL